jgi:hypothetical protein
MGECDCESYFKGIQPESDNGLTTLQLPYLSLL